MQHYNEREKDSMKNKKELIAIVASGVVVVIVVGLLLTMYMIPN